MDISVVIPTYNRAALLPLTIPALAGQECGSLRYEVIFVINGSSDDSLGILEEAARRDPAKFRIFYINPTGGPAAPRNRGIREATGEIVIILDDDVLPDRDLVLRHAEYHSRHSRLEDAALGELYVPPELLCDPVSLFHTFPYHEVRGIDRLSYLHFWTCNVSFKRNFMLRNGMFDERFLAYEDVICGHRLYRAGMHLRFLPAARGQHLHQMKADGIPSKGIWYGRWLYRFVKHLPEREVKIRFGILSRDVGWPLLLKRILHRAAFRTVDNPLIRRILCWLGAERGRRTCISDMYYYLMFRRNMLAGYKAAKLEDRAGRNPELRTVNSEWVARGE